MDRTYLFVAPEENAEVRSAGARWDDFSKRWYIGPDQAPEGFSRWLPATERDDDEFTITSSDACVAAATISCRRCHADTEVICFHCRNGMVSGETLTQFTVSGIWALDGELAQQFGPWPTFRRTAGAEHEEGVFAGEVGPTIDMRDGSIRVEPNTFNSSAFEIDEYLKRAVFNIEVAEFHTYYVGEVGLWVHDTDCRVKEAP